MEISYKVMGEQGVVRDVTIYADSDLKYYFVEVDDIRKLREGKKNQSLPMGTLVAGQRAYIAEARSSSDKSLCLIVRNRDGKLIGSACDANGVFIGDRPNRYRLTPSQERKKPVIKTLDDIRDPDPFREVRGLLNENRYNGRLRQPDDPPRNSATKWILIFIVLLICYLLYRIVKQSREQWQTQQSRR